MYLFIKESESQTGKGEYGQRYMHTAKRSTPTNGRLFLFFFFLYLFNFAFKINKEILKKNVKSHESQAGKRDAIHSRQPSQL